MADLVAAVEAAGYVARVEQARAADHEIDVAEVAAARTERDEAAAGTRPTCAGGSSSRLP